jgi:hypothetical protein
MRLAGPVTAIVDRPPLEPPLRRLLWRGLHDGAHLDHMAALAGAPETAHTAPLPIEFGTGLLAAESYAMAVEILAAAERSLDRALTEEICRGLLERVGRLPGAAARPALARVAVRPNPEYGMLPTLAAAYVSGPLRLLAGRGGTACLPERLAAALRRGWARTVADSPAASRLDRTARGLC